MRARFGDTVGGKMAQLDKTFPTNDCSMCIMSPKLVEELDTEDFGAVRAKVGEFMGVSGEQPRKTAPGRPFHEPPFPLATIRDRCVASGRAPRNLRGRQNLP